MRVISTYTKCKIEVNILNKVKIKLKNINHNTTFLIQQITGQSGQVGHIVAQEQIICVFRPNVIVHLKHLEVA